VICLLAIVGDEIARALEYEFKDIEELVRKAIEQTKDSKRKGWSFARVRDAVNKELDRVRTSFALKVLEQESDNQTRKFVQYHQLALTQALNDIASPKQQAGRGQYAEFRKFLIDTLQDLFEYLLTQYRSHLNLDFPAPITYADGVMMKMKDCSSALDGIIRGAQHLGLPSIFQTILSVDFPFTLRRIQFVDFVCARVKTLDPNALDDELHSLLLSANFNEPTFFNRSTAFLVRKLSECQTQAERIEQICLQLKMIAQLPTQPGLAYDSSQPSIKEQLLDWLTQELIFEERKNGVVSIASTKGHEATSEFKLLLDLSVAQFALLLKTLIDTSVVQNKNLSDVLRFFAQSVKTKRSENVSYESLRIKYYNPEESTKEMIKLILSNCLRYLSSH
jgi:hypothetical protein